MSLLSCVIIYRYMWDVLVIKNGKYPQHQETTGGITPALVCVCMSTCLCVGVFFQVCECEVSHK